MDRPAPAEPIRGRSAVTRRISARRPTLAVARQRLRRPRREACRCPRAVAAISPFADPDLVRGHQWSLRKARRPPTSPAKLLESMAARLSRRSPNPADPRLFRARLRGSARSAAAVDPGGRETRSCSDDAVFAFATPHWPRKGSPTRNVSRAWGARDPRSGPSYISAGLPEGPRCSR